MTCMSMFANIHNDIAMLFHRLYVMVCMQLYIYYIYIIYIYILYIYCINIIYGSSFRGTQNDLV